MGAMLTSRAPAAKSIYGLFQLADDGGAVTGDEHALISLTKIKNMEARTKHKNVIKV